MFDYRPHYEFSQRVDPRQASIATEPPDYANRLLTRNKKGGEWLN